MSAISGVNDRIVQGQLAGAQLHHEIGVRMAAKVQDAARQEGAAALKLLDAAADISKPEQSRPTLGQLASGLGRRLDVSA